MSMTAWLATKSFNKIFNNLAKELNEDVSIIQIGIYYKNSCHKYVAYTNFVKGKEINLGDYFDNIIDLAITEGSVDSTIGQAGPRYSKELSQKLQREVKTDDVNIIMKHKKDGELPYAVLMLGQEKQRAIDIETEFLN